MRKTVWTALAVFVVVLMLAAWLMFDAYAVTRDAGIARLRYQARVLAEQAANGIDEYFDYYYRTLHFLATLPEIRRMDLTGEATLEAFYAEQEGNVRAVTRLAADGTIAWSWPDASVRGRDISKQEHNTRFLATRKATLSRVFMAVQGYPAVSLVVPVWNDGAFTGGLAILVPFEEISSRYVSQIRIGETGYAILFDSDGTELYCPVPVHTGRNVRDTSADSPSMLALAEVMAGGGSGDGDYLYSAVGETVGPPVRKVARYQAVPLVDSFWTIMVTVPESEAYGFIAGFRNRWLQLAFIIVAGSLAWSVILLRTLARNQRVNRALKDTNISLETVVKELGDAQERLVLQEKLAALGQVAAGIGHQVNSPLGAIVSASGNILGVAGRNLSPALKAYAALDPDSRTLFDALLERAFEKADAADGERKGAPRQERLEAARELEGAGVADARSIADDLADMDLLAERARFAALLERPEASALVGEAQRLSSLVSSARVIRQAAERAGAVVGALRTYARAERSREATVIEVNAELEMALTLYVGPSKPGIEVKRSYGELCHVRAVPDQLVQVWTNLVVNAVQAMEGKGSLEVGARRSGDRVIVEIADSGPGIPDGVMERIFEPFFTTKPPGEGSGLGLDIARRIVDSLGGSIACESRPGRTVFRVELPAA
ncbi:MAG TPA: sensor histidine kinase [Spirochaetales bacterium]|nr:sensor histidine kinase [Spirochaetales bacterium]